MQNLIMTITDLISPCHQGPQQPQYYCRDLPGCHLDNLFPRPPSPPPGVEAVEEGVDFLCSLVQSATAVFHGKLWKDLNKASAYRCSSSQGQRKMWLVLTYMQISQVSHSIQTRNSEPHLLSRFLKKASGHCLPNRKGRLSSLLPSTELRSP